MINLKFILPDFFVLSKFQHFMGFNEFEYIITKHQFSQQNLNSNFKQNHSVLLITIKYWNCQMSKIKLSFTTLLILVILILVLILVQLYTNRNLLNQHLILCNILDHHQVNSKKDYKIQFQSCDKAVNRIDECVLQLLQESLNQNYQKYRSEFQGSKKSDLIIIILRKLLLLCIFHN
ncbi:unnamed protein product (macronuclear) [Paramecium tetraurelia]|uniref:Transmembrane protein n=1 Tax=Paramecium tetraurelia TaxID=5888 RepID=A0DIC0_PARTE|nr:uncharacterized protein GSPATT00017159001 [Paramecium tetraurelia]CAK82787.1 unnamed protein product [Paramecium tetraurelia]|eukprot:XP_001450184.1 hypothetical protein (macronuclear) [Paramecium tetraurelia strain d4-2]